MRYRRWLVLAIGGCGGSEEAATVELPVATSPAAVAAATTDLGYVVSISDMRVAVSNVQFTIEGEMHADTEAGGANLIALPHPGHSAGGEVTGELPGDFVLRWNGQAQPLLGIGTLIVGDYHGANFTFRAATPTDVDAADPLLGHAFHLVGTVAKDGTTKPFTALLDVEADTSVIGAVFEDMITEHSTDTLAIEFLATDLVEGDTAFDGIDYFTLPETAGTIEIRPGSIAHNIMRRAIQTHDQYAVIAQ